jgi:succinate dehydrogenase/fumarate reductase flavoprotein subunit
LSEPVDIIRSDDVREWHETVDVIVVGFGIAGASAALEAAGLAADVLVVERASGAGGASALSSGIFYLGGGTALQRACGFDDDPEEMYKFLLASCGAPDAALLRAYAEHGPAHFDWLESLGVPFERSFYGGKTVVPNTTHGLFWTGNERIWPYREIARPAPRGHKVAGKGERAGAVAMQPIVTAVEAAGVTAIYDTRVVALVAGDDGAVVGVRVQQSGGGPAHFRARLGVILTTGGFALNPTMTAAHLPLLSTTSEPLGMPYNDGSGIVLGQSAGGGVQAMDALTATASFYPPAQLVKGILVNARGERFVAEDSYHGRTANFIMEQPEQKAYLIVDAETFAYPKIKLHRHRLIDGWETIDEMEAGLGVPKGSLNETISVYNQHAAQGQDPLFHKDPEWLRPLDPGPYAAFDVSFDSSVYLYMTLGGLRTNVDAQVLTPRGAVVPGLYAAGACAAHLPQTGKGYASGMSLGPGSFFGRMAGRHAATSCAG